jgi:diguanylate cyclase (GGDEF)-like protein/PAS domain S-box-containing protein
MDALIVIEEDKFRGALSRFLDSQGVAAQAVADLVTAQQVLAEHDVRLVFVSEQVGNLPPADISATIRAARGASQARVVAVTASKTPEYRALIEAGFDDVIGPASTSDQIAAQAIIAARPRPAAAPVEAAQPPAVEAAAATSEPDATHAPDTIAVAPDTEPGDVTLAVTQEFSPPTLTDTEQARVYLETLRTLGFYLARGTSVERQAQNALHAINGLYPAGRAAIWLRDPDRSTVTLGRTLGLSSEYAALGARYYGSLPDEEWDALAGTPRFKDNLEGEEGDLAELVAAEGFVAALHIGLATATETIGLLALYLDEPGPLTDDELMTLEAVAAMTALAIERVRQERATPGTAADDAHLPAADISLDGTDSEPEELAPPATFDWAPVIATLPDATFLVDTEGHVLHANAALADLSGFSVDDLSMLAIFDIVADEDADRVRFQISGAPQHGSLPVTVKGAGGRTVAAELQMRAVPDELAGGEVIFLGALQPQDDSERIGTQLAAFQRMVEIMATEPNLDSALQGIVTTLADHLGYRRAGIWILDGDGDDTALTARATVPSDAPRALPRHSGIAGRVLASRTPELVADVLADPDYVRLDEAVVSLICVPITHAERVYGVLQVEADASQPLQAQDLSFLAQLAAQVSSSIERARLYQNLERQATVDLVTGLPNRQVFQQVLDRAVDNPWQGVVSVLIIGVDNFKSVNELYGHVIADDVLRQIGQVLKARMQPQHVLARYISDQFAVLLPGVGRDEAVTVAEHLRIGVGIHLFCAAEQVEQLTVSIGAATCPDDAGTPQALLQAADHAMYLAKRAGRNQTFQSNAAFATLAPAHGRINDLLRQSPRETLSLLIRAMDQRLPERAGHSERVTRYALAIAREMGVPDDELPALRMAAYIHDIGMVSLPDALLRKPSQLSPEERDLLRGVPVAAHGLLSQLDLHESILLAVLHQRENWDGTGYPTGLRGESIPLGARIIAVADALDAMTSARAHREPMSLAAALEQVNRLAGTQFDPSVASAAYCLTDVISEPVSVSATQDADSDSTDAVAETPGRKG